MARQRNLQKSISQVIEAEQKSLKWYPMADFVKLVGLEAEKAGTLLGVCCRSRQAFQLFPRVHGATQMAISHWVPIGPQNGVVFRLIFVCGVLVFGSESLPLLLRPPPPAVSHTIFHIQLCHTYSFVTRTQSLAYNVVTHTHTIFHIYTALSHAILQIQLCHTHTQPFTYNFVTHTQFLTCHLSHTALSHALFHIQLCHAQLCHPQSLTYNFVSHNLSHTSLSHTICHIQLCHAIFHIQRCHTHTHHLSHTTFHIQLCHTHSIFHTQSFTYSFVTHTLSHTTLSRTTLSHTHTISHTHTQLCHT